MSCEPSGKVKWYAFINFNDDKKEITSILSMPFKNTSSSKLKWIKFRVNYSISVTNYSQSLDKRYFCDSEEEIIYLIFWDCRHVKDLLHRIENIIVENIVPLHCSDRTIFLCVLDKKKKNIKAL